MENDYALEAMPSTATVQLLAIVWYDDADEMKYWIKISCTIKLMI